MAAKTTGTQALFVFGSATDLFHRSSHLKKCRAVAKEISETAA